MVLGGGRSGVTGPQPVAAASSDRVLLHATWSIAKRAAHGLSTKRTAPRGSQEARQAPTSLGDATSLRSRGSS